MEAEQAADVEQEQVLFKQNPVMFRNNPLGFLVSLVLCVAGVGVLILVVWWLRCKGTTLTVTNERSTLRYGILSKHTNEVWHADVRHVQVSQGFLQRMFGVGAIGISSAGGADVELAVGGIRNPNRVKDAIDQARRAAKRGG